MVREKLKNLTRDYLLRATYSHLQKFATTEKNLRAVLDRKARRRLPAEAGDELYAEAKKWIDDIVQKAVEQNLVDDYQFALSRARSLVQRGNSAQKIIQKLLALVVGTDMVTAVMEQLAAQYPDMDYRAAVNYARRRRFGAFGSDQGSDNVTEKQRASMCRAGFSYSVASRVLEMSGEELENIVYRKD